MSNIERIQKSLDDARESRAAAVKREPSKEFYFKDGDQVFATVVGDATQDISLDDYWIYSFKNGKYWTDVLAKDDRVDTSMIPLKTDGTPRWPARKFAFWAYVHYVLHPTKTSAEMEAVEGPGGRQVFKEIVGDYRILHFKFGRDEGQWDQIHNIEEDWGSLDKGVIKIRRIGASLDTVYKFQRTQLTDEIPEDRKKEISSFVPIKDYMFGRYGGEIRLYGDAQQGTMVPTYKDVLG